MRFFVFTILVALLAAFVSASLPQKAVIVSFPNETPDYIVLEAKEGLRAAVCFQQAINAKEVTNLLLREARLPMNIVS